MRNKKIEIEDLYHFRFPSNLLYSPKGNSFVYEVAEIDEEKNAYRRNIWIKREEGIKQLTANIDANIAFFENEDTLILKRKMDNQEAGITNYYQLSLNGGEALLWKSFPLNVSKINKLAENT